MILTTEMTQLFAVVLGRDSQRVTEALLREGVMQFIETSVVEPDKQDNLPTVASEDSLNRTADLRKRIEGFLHTGGVIPAPPTEADLNSRIKVDIEAESNHLDMVGSERENIRERQRVIQQEILKLEDIRRQVDLYGQGLSGVSVTARHSFISMQTGMIPAAKVRRFEDDLKGLPSLSIPLGAEGEMSHYLLISMKRDSGQVADILSHAGWANVELPSELTSVKKDVFKELSDKLEKLNKEQKKLEEKAAGLIKREQSHLKEVWTSLRVTELLYKIQTSFKSSSRTIIFTGWLPSSKKDKLTTRIKGACENRCYLEWSEAKIRQTAGEEVPVKFNNPTVLAPFQMLVSNFGIPRYGTIDPTPFVMPIYLAMFGVMFADVGQGLILALLGALGTSRLKDKPKKQGLFTLSWLIVWCGVSSILFGALFGSYFGAQWFKPLWFDFHGIISGHSSGSSIINDVMDILSITIYFGIAVISLGLIFNWINVILSRRWMELFFDKGGIIGGWIYAGGIYIAFYMASHEFKEFPSGRVVFFLVTLPALLIFIKEPHHFFEHKKHNPDEKFNAFTVLGWLMNWIVELLEIFSGYLSNTLSFMRIAGLGIAHVCLMMSFFTIAEMTGGVFAVIILILGNALVIGLEGLSAGIQALRLNYYEFFTKFFHGTGQLYTPISLSSSHK